MATRTSLKAQAEMGGSHLDISDLPDEAKQVLQEFDTDNSGAIDLAELQLAAQAYKAQKEQNRLMKVALIFMAAFFALLCGTMAGLIYAVAEANKDTSASDGGAMTGKTSGTVVSTGSSETVNINGKQVPRTFIAELIAADQAAGGGPTTARRRLAGTAEASLSDLETAWALAPAGKLSVTAARRHRRQLRKQRKQRRGLQQDGYYDEPYADYGPDGYYGPYGDYPYYEFYDFGNYDYYYYDYEWPDSGTAQNTTGEYMPNNTSDMPTGGTEAVISNDPNQQYDSYSNITHDDLTEPMLAFIDKYGSASECAISTRRFEELNSLMNPIYFDFIRQIEIEQGPIRLVFDVTSAGSMPRCALNGSPYDGYDPCQDAPPPAPWDVVIVLELDMGWPGAGIIVLDRNHIRFPMNIYSDARWQLMNHGIKIPENSDKLDAFVVGHFSNVAMLNAMRCMDGSAPNPRTGVCADVLEEANRASEFLMPFPELVNGMIDIPVILPGSTELSDGFNHNGIFERFESVAVRPWLDAFGCNPFHTRGVNDPSGEIWQMSSILNDEHIAYIEKYDAFGNFVDANYDSNMWKRDMWRNYSPFEPVMPKLCRYADLWETFDGTNGGGELVLFVAKQRTGSGLSNWTLMALDPNVYSPEDWNGGTNVYILADLGSLGPVTTTAPPKGMFYDGKFRKVYLTVDNMLVEVDIGAITNVFPPTGPIAPTVIVNTSNIAANPTAPSPEIDNLDRAFARLNQPQGIAGRLFFQPSTPESTDEPCVSDQGCLVVADTGSHRIRLVDMSPSGGVGVFTAVGDGNLMCDPGSYDTSSPESFDETVLAGAMPCSRDGFVLPSIEDWWMNGGWDNYPFNVPADVPVADVDSPMQLFIDAADNFNPESGPSFHVWMTEKTSKGTFIKVLGQNGEIRTIAEMSTIEPKRPRMLQQAALTQKWFIGVFDDGTLGRAMSVMPASVDPAFYNDGYNPEADYAVNNTPEAVAERRRKRRLALA